MSRALPEQVQAGVADVGPIRMAGLHDDVHTQVVRGVSSIENWLA